MLSRNLSHADLIMCWLRYAELSYSGGAELSYAKLNYVEFNFVKFTYADLGFTKLIYAELSYVC